MPLPVASTPHGGDDGPSSIGRAMGVLGDRWTLLILRDAFLRCTRRFTVWRDALGISDPVLARRLRDLVGAGILRRVPYSTAPERHEYLLTEAGLELWSLLLAIWGWERRWGRGRAATPPDLVHDRCGSPVRPQLACAGCGALVGARDTAAERAPGYAAERNAPPRRRRRSQRGDQPSDPGQPFSETMALLGDRWITVIVAAAFLRTRRFAEFERTLGVPPTLLTQRLRTLVQLGVLRRAPSGGRPGVHEYRLTEKGLAFFPVMVLVARWANRWMPTPAGPPVRISHPACGAVLEPVLACDACGEALQRVELHVAHQRGAAVEATRRRIIDLTPGGADAERPPRGGDPEDRAGNAAPATGSGLDGVRPPWHTPCPPSPSTPPTAPPPSSASRGCAST